MNSNNINVYIRFGGGILDMNKSSIFLNFFTEILFIYGGLLTHSYSEINKILSDRSIFVNFEIAEDSFLLNGVSLADQDDFGLLMAILCHYIKQPGFRDEALQKFRSCITKLYRVIEKNPAIKLISIIKKIVTNEDYRLCIPSFDKISKIEMKDFKDLIIDTLRQSRMEITIVGNVSVRDAIQKTAMTFGTLPTRSNEKPSYEFERKVNINREACNLKCYFNGEDPKELLSVFWITCGSSNETILDNWTLQVIRAIIADRMRTKIRKFMGEAYSPLVTSINNKTFYGLGSLKVEISIDPTKFDIVKHIIDEEISDLYRNGVTEDEFYRALEPIVQEEKNKLEGDFFWIENLSVSQEKPEVLDWIRQSYNFFRSMSPNAINAVIKKYLKPEAMSCIRMCQEEKNSAEETK
jgi:zinc protease